MRIISISDEDVLLGVNDASHFLHYAANNRNESMSVEQLFKDTKEKRRWSIVNPGFILSLAYSYFVFGYERKLIKEFCFQSWLRKITVEHNDFDKMSIKKKSDFLKRRLRNSIAHCSFKVEIRSSSGRIETDGDLWFVFFDENRNGNDKVKIEINLPDFGNILEEVGELCFRKLKPISGVNG